MANPKLQTLVERFDGGALNTTLWNNVTGGAVTFDAVNDQVVIAVGTTSNTYNNLGALGPYDATGSYLYAQVTPAPNGNGGITTYMKLQKDANNQIQLQLNSSSFQVYQQSGGTWSLAATLPTYDPHQHRWWRISEAGGNFLFATAPDGYTWTTQATVAHTWDASSVQAVFQTGTSDAEPAGLAATIAHVNTTTPAVGQPNINWPLLEDAWGPYWGANGGDIPLDRYVDLTDRTRGATSVMRGRQYELDQVRSGEASLTLANTDAALDPTNAAGPWAGHILPYQPLRVRAQWPPTRNMLTQVQATGGDLGGYSAGTIPQGNAGIDVFSSTDSGGGTITASTTAWRGGSVFQFSVPSGTTTQTSICYTRQPAVKPGVTYTVQMQVRNITASTSQQVDAFIVFANVAGTLTTARSTVTTLTGSTTAGWTPLTVTGTAPSDAARISVGVETGGTAAATCSVQVDGWQMERGASASTWAAPGVWYPVYAGWTERWPSTWDMHGTYGKVQPTAVDSFSLLSQQQLSDPLTQEINSNSPRFVYKLDDPAGSTMAADWTGENPGAQLAISKYGAGSWVFGSAITATDSTGTYTGSSGTVSTLNNSNPGTGLTSGGATFLQLTAAGLKGPADPTLWTRMIAFRYTGPTPTAAACMWSSMDTQRSGGTPSGSHIYIYLYTDGKPVFHMQGPGGTNVNTYFTGATTCVDGDWHLLVFGYNQALNQVILSQDGAVGTMGSLSTAVTPTGLVSDNVGGFVDITVGNGTTWNWKGDISFAAEFPSYLSPTAIANLYTAWKSACAGESSNARYARILRYAGYTGPSALQTGLTTSMGAANIAGQDAMTALQAVVDTENGAHFIDRSGTVQFKARSDRYNALTPAYIFGENTAAGEYPYEDCQLDFDSTHLSNQVTITQEATNQNFHATDATSVASYFPRTLTRTINSSSTSECQDAANYLVSRYKTPATRVSAVKLHPSANPALWPVCLSLELGTRIRVMRRAPGVPADQVDCFIEQIQVDTDDSGEAFWTLQCSPADLTPYGIFAAFHTTLATTIAVGVSTISINAGADSTNPAAAQIGQGQQLVLGLGTAAQETVTVLSVGTTTSGWTTATITLQAATTQPHTAGDVVCEPLPSGVTTATKYDSSAVFDSVAFAY